MNILIYVVQGVCISGTQLSRFAYSKDVKHRKETIVALKELQYFYYSVVMIIQLSILKQRQRREKGKKMSVRHRHLGQTQKF